MNRYIVMLRPCTLFWVACLPARVALAYIVYIVAHGSSKQRQRLLALLFALMGVGMAATHIVGRPRGTFGQPAWWSNLRPLHAAMWLAIAVCLLVVATRSRGASHGRRRAALGATVLAVADVVLGASARKPCRQEEKGGGGSGSCSSRCLGGLR